MVVQATQYAALRARVVVLDERAAQAGGLGEGASVEAFIEEAAFIAEHLGLENQYIRQLGGDYMHGHSSARPNRYWP
ncbi:hypothetical protein D9M68_995640 [compost metagenome]